MFSSFSTVATCGKLDSSSEFGVYISTLHWANEPSMRFIVTLIPFKDFFTYIELFPPEEKQSMKSSWSDLHVSSHLLDLD